MTISLDATAVNQSSPNTSSYNGSLLTTINTFAKSIIVVMVGVEYPSQIPASVSSVTSSGLTFFNRSKYINTGMNAGGSQNIEFWWAVAPSSGNISVSVNFAGGYADDIAVVMYSVSGCNTINPWDSNSSFPAQLPYNNSSKSISTTSSNNMIISFYVTPGTNASTAMHPITPIGGSNAVSAYMENIGGLWFELGYSAYGINTTQQSNVTWGWAGVAAGNLAGTYATSTSSFYVVIDALTAATNNGNFLAFC